MNQPFENISSIFRFSFFCLLIGLTTVSFTLPDHSENLLLEKFDNCPTASFTTSNNGCIGPCEITFNNQSQGATSYHWDFGDGDSSTEINPRHTYQFEGTYTVTLTAIVDGCSVPFIGTVDVVGS